MSALEDRKFITPFSPEQQQAGSPETGAQTAVETAEQGILTPEQQENMQNAAAMPEMHGNGAPAHGAGINGAEISGAASVRSAENAVSPELRKSDALKKLDRGLTGEGPMSDVNIHDFEGVPPDQILESIMKDR